MTAVVSRPQRAGDNEASLSRGTAGFCADEPGLLREAFDEFVEKVRGGGIVFVDSIVNGAHCCDTRFNGRHHHVGRTVGVDLACGELW